MGALPYICRCANQQNIINYLIPISYLYIEIEMCELSGYAQRRYAKDINIFTKSSHK